MHSRHGQRALNLKQMANWIGKSAKRSEADTSKFKFPLASPSTPTDGPSTAGSDIPMTASSVGTDSVDTTSSAGEVSASHQKPAAATSPDTATGSGPEAPSSAGAIPVDVPSIGNSSITEEPESDASPITAETNEKPHASTIDEAISNFHDAVKTPQPETPEDKPKTPTIELNGTPIEEPSEGRQRKEDDAKISPTEAKAEVQMNGSVKNGVNGVKAEEIATGEPVEQATEGRKSSGKGHRSEDPIGDEGLDEVDLS